MNIGLILPLIQGLGLGGSLIIAIGAQNAYVLRQGLKRHFVLITALVCTLCDVVLILVGVGGLGTFIASSAILTAIARWGGAAFLLFYAIQSFWSVLKTSGLEAATNGSPIQDRGQAILTTLAFSLLNPHVYLDTVVLIGSIGAQYPLTERPFFALGAILASTIWFFGLAYSAAWLAPYLERPLVWRVIDLVISAIMLLLAISLVRG